MKVFIKRVGNLSRNIDQIFSSFTQLVNLKNKKVVVKPNWVVPRTSDTGVTTTLKLVGEVIAQLKKKGAEVLIAESAGYEFDSEKINKILKIGDFAKKYQVSVLNTRKCPTKKVNIKGKVLKEIKLPKEVLEADLIFNLPKFKTHMLTDVSFSLKNLLGLLPLESRRKAHTYGIHQAIVDLNKFLDKTFVIVDGTTAMGGCGPTFGDVIQPKVLIASKNCLAADLVCCQIAGVNYKKVKHLQLAYEQMKTDRLEITGDQDFRIKNFKLPKVSKFYRGLYRGVFVLEELLYPLFKKSLVAEIVTRFGTKPVIIKSKVRDKQKLIDVCPVGAINEDLEIDFEKCRHVRCLRCYDQFPKAVQIRGISKPRRE